jgi:hypothetical protein
MSSARASTVVYEDFRMIAGDLVSTTPFEVTQPGIYQADLVDFEFPAPFDILALGITQDMESLGFGFGTGSFTFEVTTPGTLLAHLAAIPAEEGVGTYALQIKAVPIGPSAVLFLSGLIGMVTVGRRNNKPGTA